ncbi:MAG: aspartate ammonia-lyase [Erysipelotrichaceae bacterium]|nr:aspartate ammonia-lyase [Erysipelotrichaceae bacterium]
MNHPQYRLEQDSIGTKEIPADALYGVHSLRARENFPITGLPIHRQMIIAIAAVKKACAIANFNAGLLPENKKDAITAACQKIMKGHYHDSFITDAIQGGAGTSMNMNANEVIANLALQIMGETKGNYSVISPTDDVNMGQSTNDVIPTAGKIATIRLLSLLDVQLNRLIETFDRKAEEFDDVLKMGRTQLEDAVPIRLGQEFRAYATATRRCRKRIRQFSAEMHIVNLGGTAIGTGINADLQYESSVVNTLSKVTHISLKQAEDLIDATQNIDCFLAISGALKACAVTLSKISNDLRLLSSGPRTGICEINLPARQNGSSIMPGKVNPVIPEVMNQIAFNIIGNDQAITMAAEAGQLELNAFEPVAFYNLFQSIETLTNGISTFVDHCVEGITANREHCQKLVDNSIGTVTALAPYLGYQKSAEIAKKALATGESIKSLVLKENLMSKQQLDIIMDATRMTSPGILGKQD